MRAFPAGADEAVERSANVVIRTDFSDDGGWLGTLEALEQAPEDWEDDEFEVDNFVIDDPSWAEATPDEILEVVRRDQYLAEYLDVFLVADKQAVAGEEHLLLVVTAYDPQDEMYDDVVRFGREFRCLPSEAHSIIANLGVGNMDFQEFSKAAAASSDGVFRGWP
ncbi:DUF6924 domain-containing protein [Paractinoplanes hotanensis]|uniref:DUF6924 domain-containing protein n=1 Tax=Paractinoplanes hotanensis TaxID=2906497 RepID=A0ABT0YC29_9ACTN|nr:hypothetical protein [Actinoplanes hotanensis]MCM4083607.1 hypothetical protein [Actinoplanes hotanensis]